MHLAFPGARGRGTVTGRSPSKYFQFEQPSVLLVRLQYLLFLVRPWRAAERGLPDIVGVQLRSFLMSMASSGEATESHRLARRCS
jgi:hypothetical protein